MPPHWSHGNMRAAAIKYPHRAVKKIGRMEKAIAKGCAAKLEKRV
jgi:hypothetical protein